RVTGDDLGLRFPVVVKATPHRDRRWEEAGFATKVLLVNDPTALRDVVTRIDGTGLEAIAQELIPGPEDRIESYHVYVDDAGAVAGVNLPAIVHADLTGRRRPPVGRARAGVRWIWPRADAAAARSSGVPRLSWLLWALRSETNSSFALSDPAPYLVRRLRDMVG